MVRKSKPQLQSHQVRPNKLHTNLNNNYIGERLTLTGTVRQSHGIIGESNNTNPFNTLLCEEKSSAMVILHHFKKGMWHPDWITSLKMKVFKLAI